MYMRTRVRARSGLSPFEILFGRPAPIGLHPPGQPHALTDHCDDDMLKYFKVLSSMLSKNHQQVKDALPQPKEGRLHDLEPGDWVVVKDFRRKSWKQPRWLGPYQILLITESAVKVAERATWIHASHCRKVPEPAEDTEVILKTTCAPGT
ncbi:hypothetical protein LDENG_00158280 [Lucifuga dentata]|nr:hypothetical protein LDENG_00158280 [Lucifuga dentata]